MTLSPIGPKIDSQPLNDNFAYLDAQLAETVNQVFNVNTGYGAVGDGVANDATAIQAAIDACSAAGGGIVYFIPLKNYLINSKLTIPSNVKFLSYQARIFGLLSTSMVDITGDNVEIEGVWFDNTNTDTGNLFTTINVAANVEHVTIRHCEFSGLRSYGVHMNATGIKHITIKDSLFDGCNYGVLTNTNATDLNDLKILDNDFINIYSDAIELNHPGVAYTSGKNIIIDGNYISVTNGSASTGGFGVGIAGATRVVVSNNVLEACRNQAIHVEDEAKHIVISNNIIDGTGTAPATSNNSGIHIIDGDDITVVGNQIYNCNDHGIQCEFDATNQATMITIIGNTCAGNAGSGIRFAGQNASNAVISSNICNGNTVDGIVVGGTPRDIKIKDNICTGNTEYGLRFGSSLIGPDIHGNTLHDNTAGDITITSATYPIPVKSQNKVFTATVTSNLTPYTTVFSLGTGAQGTMIMTAVQSANRSTEMYNIAWDGTALTATLLASDNSGSANLSPPQMSGNDVQVRTSVTAADGTSVTFDVQFEGIIMFK